MPASRARHRPASRPARAPSVESCASRLRRIRAALASRAPRAHDGRTMSFGREKIILGRSGLKVGRIGLGMSSGLSESDVEEAVERGVNYLYWGSIRGERYGRAIRHVAKK